MRQTGTVGRDPAPKCPFFFLINRPEHPNCWWYYLEEGGRKAEWIRSVCSPSVWVVLGSYWYDPTRPDPVPMNLVVRPTGDWS
jgi:hypothetical protein